MKKTALFIMLVLALSINVNAQEKKGKFRAYSVAFYNLENLFDTINNNGRYDLEFSPQGKNQWDSHKYTQKLIKMSSVIANMTTEVTPNGPAVIGVSEIENRSVLEDLVKEPSIRSRMYQVVHHDGPDPRGVDVGLLYDPRQFKVINVNTHLLTVPENPRFRTRDQLCVTGLLGGDTISIIVNHWPSRTRGQAASNYLREAAAALSKHIADSLLAIRPNQGVIIMGDLNDDPMDSSCAKVVGAKKDEKDVKLPDGFFNPFWRMLDRGIGTLAYRGSWNLFDQIMVSATLLKQYAKPGHLEYWKCKVDNFDFLIDQQGVRAGSPLRTFSQGMWLNGYSDHLPTEVFLIQRF